MPATSTTSPRPPRPELAGLVADRGVDCCLMHMLGEPRTMQGDPRYDDVVDDVKAFLEERMAAAVKAGVRADPARPRDRLRQVPLRAQPRAAAAARRAGALGRPLVIGTSRKSFSAALTGRDVTERVHATVATSVIAFERGARVFRVHDVAATADALAVTAATFAPWPPTPTRSTTTTS